MSNMTRRGRPSIFGLRRDLDEVLDDFVSPRALRREIDRLFAEDLGPGAIWQELDQLLEDFVAPAPLRRRASALFEPFGGAGRGAPMLGSGRGGGALFVPDVELTERENEYLVKVDLPGVRSEDVDVSVDDRNVLTIRGERRDEQRRESRGFEYTERSYGSFSRSIELPRGIDASRIVAEHHDGVLELHVPKSEQAMTGRKIPIRMGGQMGGQMGQMGGQMGQTGGQMPREPSRAQPTEQPRVMSPSSDQGNRSNQGNQGNQGRETRTQANSR